MNGGEITRGEGLRIAGELEAFARQEGNTPSRADLETAAAIIRTVFDEFQLNNIAMAEALMLATDAAHQLGEDLVVCRRVRQRLWVVGLHMGTTARATVTRSGLLPALRDLVGLAQARTDPVHWYIFEYIPTGPIVAEVARPARYAQCTAGRAAQLMVSFGMGWSCRTIFPDEKPDPEMTIR